MTVLWKRICLAVFAVVAACFSGVPSAIAGCDGRNLWADLETRHPQVAQEIEARVRAMPFAEGRLFRLTKPGQPVSYVLGTIHVYDRRYLPLSKGILDAFKATRVTMLELKSAREESIYNFSSREIPDAVLQSFGEAGQRPVDFLSEEERRKIEENVAGFGMPASTLMTLRPVLLAEALSYGPCPIPGGKKMGIDAELERLSLKDFKLVLGLETTLEQMSALNNVPFNVQKEMLRTSIRTLDRGADLLETTKSLYIEGRLGRLVTVVYGGIAEIETDYGTFPLVYSKALIDDRNHRMAQRALPFLAVNSTFIAVGAAHLPGEHGILKLLQDAGYKVEKVE